MTIPEKISCGELLFRGSNDKEILEIGIAPPLLNEIREQIINFCVGLSNNEVYLLSWQIHKGKLTESSYEKTD